MVGKGQGLWDYPHEPRRTRTKCQQVKPVRQVYRLLPSNPLDEAIDFLGHKRLLLLQGRVGKGTREETAHLVVLLGIPLAHDGVGLVRKVAAIVKDAFSERARLSFSDSVNIRPGPGAVEGQVVGGDSNDGP